MTSEYFRLNVNALLSGTPNGCTVRSCPMYGRLCPSCDSQAQVQILLLLQPLVSRPCIEGYGTQQLVHTDSS